jgi:hypothetical protein
MTGTEDSQMESIPMPVLLVLFAAVIFLAGCWKLGGGGMAEP